MERLEQIKDRTSKRYHGFEEVVFVSVADFDWLIEQAEKYEKVMKAQRSEYSSFYE